MQFCIVRDLRVGADHQIFESYGYGLVGAFCALPCALSHYALWSTDNDSLPAEVRRQHRGWMGHSHQLADRLDTSKQHWRIRWDHPCLTHQSALWLSLDFYHRPGGLYRVQLSELIRHQSGDAHGRSSPVRHTLWIFQRRSTGVLAIVDEPSGRLGNDEVDEEDLGKRWRALEERGHTPQPSVANAECTIGDPSGNNRPEVPGRIVE